MSLAKLEIEIEHLSAKVWLAFGKTNLQFRLDHSADK